MKILWQRQHKLLGLLVALVLIAAIAVAGCGGNSGGGDSSGGEGDSEDVVSTEIKTVKIGIIDTYSGPAAGYAEDALAGFELALEEIAQSGDLDIKIEFVTRDDEFNVSKALEWARELVEREGVDILAGTINSGGALAVSEYAKEKKVPFLVWNSQSENITGKNGHRYVFGMMPNALMSGSSGGVGMADKPFTKYWIAGSDYDYGHSVINNFWGTLQENKPDVEKIGESWWPPGEADFTPYFNAIRSAKPDALAIGAGGADMIPVMKAIAATGLNEEMAIWIHTGTDLATLSPLGTEAPVGIYGTATYHYYYPETAENTAFANAFAAVNDKQPGFTALNGYVAGKYIGKGLKIAGDVDMEKFVDALKGLTLDSPVGQITIRDYDNQVISPMFFGVTAKDGDNPNLISEDIFVLQGEDIAPALDKVKQARGE